MKTYTKILVAAVMATYFLGFAAGGVLVFLYPEHLGEWLTYIGIPTATAIGFYCWKAKAENVLKMRREAPQVAPKTDEPTPTLDEILQEIEEEKML